MEYSPVAVGLREEENQDAEEQGFSAVTLRNAANEITHCVARPVKATPEAT
jgi:hypothetical protein